VGTSVTFSANTSAPATLGWSFGDRFYAEEIAQTAVHNFSVIGKLPLVCVRDLSSSPN
jgi:hypothetical protein